MPSIWHLPEECCSVFRSHNLLYVVALMNIGELHFERSYIWHPVGPKVMYGWQWFQRLTASLLKGYSRMIIYYDIAHKTKWFTIFSRWRRNLPSTRKTRPVLLSKICTFVYPHRKHRRILLLRFRHQFDLWATIQLMVGTEDQERGLWGVKIRWPLNSCMRLMSLSLANPVLMY